MPLVLALLSDFSIGLYIFFVWNWSIIYPTLAINDKALLYAFNNGTTNVKITRLSA
ncbi:transmembrane protein, putative [Medicago truncatula]|uniref:Transmembrane protein, putative n=1 Tax=Medicago truncatula TaxID=3880 RepID=G7K0R3_MEDTR|nr:transmembrane protein, putative [Medicago truncatula]